MHHTVNTPSHAVKTLPLSTPPMHLFRALGGSVKSGRLPVPPVLPAPHPDNLRMNGSRDAVIHLAVDFGEGVSLIRGGIQDISHAGSINNVAHLQDKTNRATDSQSRHCCSCCDTLLERVTYHKTLDSLILGYHGCR